MSPSILSFSLHTHTLFLSLSLSLDNHHSPDCDGESVCSDSSWVITPAPAFQCSSLAPPSESSHPLEDLLIEHPTMSVYCCNQSDGKENLNEQTDAMSDSTNNQLQSKPPSENLNNTQQQEEQEHDEELRLRNQQRRETVLRQNRQRQQLAIHMQIPLVHKRGTRRAAALSASDGKLPPPTKRALKRQNKNNLHQRGGKLHQGNRVQKCTFKAGRRRC